MRWIIGRKSNDRDRQLIQKWRRPIQGSPARTLSKGNAGFPLVWTPSSAMGYVVSGGSPSMIAVSARTVSFSIALCPAVVLT